MKCLLTITSLVLLIFHFHTANAQNTGKPNKPNSINTYVGLFDLNLNYERNIIQRAKAASNIRIGFGHGQFVVAGEGYYVNGVFVQLIGEGSSHLELNAGVKYMVSNSEANPPFSDQLLPDIFLGYRYQNPTDRIIFRMGFNYPTIINIGLGYQF